MISVIRGIGSVALFAVFGVGAVVFAPLMWLSGGRRSGQPMIRALWRPMVWLLVGTGMIKVESDDFAGIRGEVIVANHPSLIDVVLLVALIPKTMFVAKRALRRNPFTFAFVRAAALPDDERLPQEAAGYLADGWNVLIFPEGTRTRMDGVIRKLRRGAAQTASRNGVPIRCVRIDFSERMLAKHQPIWQVCARRVKVKIRDRGAIASQRQAGETAHAAAIRLTQAIAGAIAG